MVYNYLITVFTSTYNRAYLLPRLYSSLCRQEFKDFEWLVIDDGSTDNTEELMVKYSSQGIINIRYIKTTNGGKHRAINLAAKEAKGELFYIIDSDDYLYDDALQIISLYYGEIRMDNSFGGIWGLKTHPNGKKLGGGVYSKIDCTYLEFRYKYHIGGDMAEFFKTDVIREFQFPDISNEKFCSEGLLWTRIASKYKLRFIYEKICICQYLVDGLTSNTIKVRINSPQYASIGYIEHTHASVPFVIKIKSAINFWRFAVYTRWSFKKKIGLIGWQYLLCLLFAFFFIIRDSYICRSSLPNINLNKRNSN